MQLISNNGNGLYFMKSGRALAAKIIDIDRQHPRTKTGLVVGMSTSLASPGSALPQEEKLKLAHKLLSVSSQIIRILVFCLIK